MSIAKKGVQKIWKFGGKKLQIRAGADKKEWFCGKDVCKILGYVNVKKALREQNSLSGLGPIAGLKYHDGKAIYISGSGLYSLHPGICQLKESIGGTTR